MIVLPFKHFKMCLHFSFFATISLVILLNDNNYAVYALIACIFHECGHLIAMRFTGQKIKTLLFYGAGIKIVKSKNNAISSFKNDFIVAVSGCVVNIVLFLCCIKINNTDIALFGYINLIIGLFNLLPISSLDGGTLISLLLHRLCDYENAVCFEKYLKGINVFIGLVVLIVFALIGCMNFTIYLTIIYLLLMTVFM